MGYLVQGDMESRKLLPASASQPPAINPHLPLRPPATLLRRRDTPLLLGSRWGREEQVKRSASGAQS